MPLFISGGANFDGFDGLSLAVLYLAAGGTILFLLTFAWRWFATFPYQPKPGPATNDLGEEPPAVVNLLVHRCAVTRPALAATVLDLAARGMLAVEQYGRQVVIRVREHRIEGEKLAAYERQVLDHIRRHATGGSAPIEALAFDSPGQSEGFWKAFRKSVVSDARARKLVRSRWGSKDWTVMGAFLAVALALFAFAFGLAHLGEESTGSGDDWGRWDWFWVAGITWAVLMALLGTLRDLRDTPAGRAAAARWLGVRGYLRDAEAFEDAPAAAVTVWDRYLAYGAALGVAHEAVRAMPFDDEDPESAWSRYGGHWREIDVRYPQRFSFGQPPFKVFLQGLARTALWGFIGFYLLPIVVRTLLDVGPDLLDTEQVDGHWGLYVAVGGVVAFLAVAGVICAANIVAGAIRLWRGAADLGKPTVLEGEVVKVYNGRVVVDDGQIEEATGWTPPVGAPGVRRGMKVRVTHTRRLWHVKQVEVLDAGPAFAPLAAGSASAAFEDAVAPMAAALGGALGILRAATGFALVPGESVTSGPMTRQPFSDAAGNSVTVSRMPIEGAAATGAAAAMTRIAMAHGEPVPGLGTDAWWTGERALVIRTPTEVLTVEATVGGGDGAARKAAAMEAAKDLLAAE